MSKTHANLTWITATILFTLKLTLVKFQASTYQNTNPFKLSSLFKSQAFYFLEKNDCNINCDLLRRIHTIPDFSTSKIITTKANFTVSALIFISYLILIISGRWHCNNMAAAAERFYSNRLRIMSLPCDLRMFIRVMPLIILKRRTRSGKGRIENLLWKTPATVHIVVMFSNLKLRWDLFWWEYMGVYVTNSW